MSVTALILSHRDKWVQANKWADPDLAYAALFMITEYHEMCFESAPTAVVVEAFDLAMMGMFTGLALGETLEIEPYTSVVDSEWRIDSKLNTLMKQLPELVTRCNPAFTRNNPKADDHKAKLKECLKEIISLSAQIVAMYGYDLNEVAIDKLTVMDKKRGFERGIKNVSYLS